MRTDQETDPSAFYMPLETEGTFEATSATASPWDDRMQHGGPPAALLLRAMERTRPDADMPVARLTVDFLGSIPRGRMRTEATVLRPGRRVELVEARLWADDTLAVTATGWRIARSEESTRAYAAPPAPLPPVPPAPEGPVTFFPGVAPSWGYGLATDWRFVEGGYAIPGPAKVWTRVRLPLVAGEEITPAQRLVVVADSVNGLSGQLPITEWFFIPPTLTVTFERQPVGEWVYVDASSTIGPHGTGLAQGSLHDEAGLVAVAAQPLLVTKRA